MYSYVKHLIVCLAVLSSYAVSAEPIVIGESFSIQSEILDETRYYSVNLPASYNNGYDQHYPVLYLLDGETFFVSATGMIDYMSSGKNANFQIPELIVVAVNNYGGNYIRDFTPSHSQIDWRGQEDTSLDVSGGGKQFLQFLEQELIPHIDESYRTKTYRTIFGNSYAGLMILQSFLTQPQVFQNFIVASPNLWWNNKEIMGSAASFLERKPGARASIYVANAEPTAASSRLHKLLVADSAIFADQFKKSASPGLYVDNVRFEGEDRKSVPFVALYHGLLHAFDGYRLPVEEYFKGPDIVAAHYEGFSEKVGFQFLPSEYFVELIVRFQERSMEPGAAVGLLEMNVRNYPQSERAREVLKRYKDKRTVSNDDVPAKR